MTHRLFSRCAARASYHFAALALALTVFPPAAVAAMTTHLVAPPAPVEAGREVTLTLVGLNEGVQPDTWRMPNECACRLACAALTQTVTAVRADLPAGAPTDVMVAPAAFALCRYRLAVPASCAGLLRVEVPSFGVTASLSVIASPPAAAPSGPVASPSVTVSNQAYSSLDAFTHLYQPYFNRITANNPTYFLFGTDPRNSKFQVSIKYKLLGLTSNDGAAGTNQSGLFLGYTQTSFWDLGSVSKPFKDTSYKPELFFLSHNLYGYGPLKGIFLQTGFQHESNGRDGADSRSTNHAYIKPRLCFYDDDTRLSVEVAPKVWAYVGNADDTNPDLDKYRGWFVLEVKAGHAHGPVVSTQMWWADKGPSFQVDLTYPLDRMPIPLPGLYLQAEYFNGYAESLLDYRDHSSALRLGIGLVR